MVCAHGQPHGNSGDHARGIKDIHAHRLIMHMQSDYRDTTARPPGDRSEWVESGSAGRVVTDNESELSYTELQTYKGVQQIYNARPASIRPFSNNSRYSGTAYGY